MGTALVIGGGPNGLAAAITLASRGHSVTVVEAREALGGRADLLSDTRTVQPWAVESMGLDVEWETSPPWLRVGSEGVHSDDEAAAGVAAWRAEVARFTAVVRSLSAAPPPNIQSDASLSALMGPAFAMLKLGRSAGLELARVGPLCAEDWLDEWGIARDVQAGLIAPALIGTWMGPRSPTSALAVLFHHALSGDSIQGGMAALLAALVKRAKGAGVTVRTSARVCRIAVSDGRATGVELDDESTIKADIVLSTVGPKRTLLHLVHPRDLPMGGDQTVRTVRTRGIVAVWKARVSEPAFGGSACAVIGADTVVIEQSFDDAKHRRLSQRPTLLVHQETGRLLVHVYGAAHDLDGGWTDAAKVGLQKTLEAVLAEHMDVATITDAELWTPADLEAEYDLEGGHLFHGEFALDQFLSFRPHPSLSGYTTGIEGLLLGGAGMHPAGGFTLCQGILAARQA